jgi:hypothetical protein
MRQFAIEARLVGPRSSTGAIMGARWRTPVKTRHERRFSSAARAARPGHLAAALGCAMAAAGATLAAAAEVTFERLANPEPQNWL